MEKKYLILAYYLIQPVEDAHQCVKEHKNFFKNRDVAGRIYISSEGINGQMSGKKSDCEAYMQWLKEMPGFEDIKFKIDSYHENIFFKMAVKYRDQLVAFDRDVDFKNVGKHMSPEEWKRHIESENEDYLLIDVRNDYESKVGHFEGADLPACKTFREFTQYTEKELIENRKVDKDKKILMYCTGGIRCEYYSAYMKEKGFENVHQLDGGVINYAHKVGDKHWNGKLFVFDDRLVAQLGQEDKCISTCHHCQVKVDEYYNCANMDCNFLFNCCSNCLDKFKGCCKQKCSESARLRPVTHFTGKPFRKWYYYLPESQMSH
ncbi:MAG: hypothetical protein S4CHLAM6_10760 [Chlamydiae bacterium]|nr:hypothetical protein [Chlamydiota bacterium]